MTPTILESPYKGNIQRNIRYAQLCAREMMFRYGECAFASHLFYTQFMNDLNPFERRLGIHASVTWGRAIRAVAVYTDLGITEGMKLAIDAHGGNVIFRNLYDPWMQLV